MVDQLPQGGNRDRELPFGEDRDDAFHYPGINIGLTEDCMQSMQLGGGRAQTSGVSVLGKLSQGPGRSGAGRSPLLQCFPQSRARHGDLTHEFPIAPHRMAQMECGSDYGGII